MELGIRVRIPSEAALETRIWVQGVYLERAENISRGVGEWEKEEKLLF